VCSSDLSPGQGSQPQREDRTALRKLAYDQGLRTLDDQRDEMNGIRTRAGQFMAIVTAATAFLVGTSLASTAAQHPLIGLAIPATICSVTAILCTVAVLWPWTFDFRLSAGVLTERWIDRSVPAPSEDDFLRGLAITLDEMRKQNEPILRRMRNCYVGVVSFGTVGLTLWTLLAWLSN